MSLSLGLGFVMCKQSLSRIASTTGDSISKGVCLTAVVALWLGIVPTQLIAGGLADPDRLRSELTALAKAHPGRVGICAQDEASPPICVNGDQRFSLQSVMKVVVAAAVMHAADDRRIALQDRVIIRREDLSVNIQPIAAIVAKNGAFETTVEDLVRRAVVESDSAATDVLISLLGGTRTVQAFLDDAGLQGIRIDRTERELQTETDGLIWIPEFVYPERLEQARKEVPEAKREAAFEIYLKDPRDTATPRDMVAFLHRLATGQLLTASSAAHLLEIMNGTVTFPDRLRAGVPSGWTIGHKTGTSQTRGGVNGVTNDVGILTAPDGARIAVAAFVAESRAEKGERAAIIAAAARAITAAYK